MTKIKICGLNRPEDIVYVNEAQPDFCGFIINYPKSHRNVTPSQVRALTKNLEKSIIPVGVFVNSPMEDIIALAEDGTLGTVQLHGTESPQEIEVLKQKVSIPVIKAFTVSSPEDLLRAKESPADYVLLDNGRGTGQTFDWTLLSDLGRPYFLAGGLTPENLSEAIRNFHPYAVDLSSGVETDKRKDRTKILAAMAAVRSIDI